VILENYFALESNMQKFIYPFTLGDKNQSDLLGGKGANLAEMVKLG
jgi:pyruvate,orthophosphate dikinase